MHCLHALSLLASTATLVAASPLASPRPYAAEHTLARRATAVKCTTTATCSAASYDVPKNAHYACNKSLGVCTWACNTGFAVQGSDYAETCTVSSDCKKAAPANANKYCNEGFCSWRCRSGFTNTRSACINPTASAANSATPSTASSSSVATSTRTTSATTTRTLSGMTTSTTSRPSSTSTTSSSSTSASTPNSTSSSASTTSSALTTSSTTSSTSTLTTSAAASSTASTCTLSPDCTNTIPSNANRYCAGGLCSWRCSSGYTSTGSACVRTATTSSTPSSTSSSPPTSTSPLSWPTPVWSRPCAANTDCDYFTPADTYNYCDAGFCSWRCNDGYVLTHGGRGCAAAKPTPPPAATAPAQTPTLVRSYGGSTFFERWDFLNESDPTHGSVIYVSREYAEAHGLTYITPEGSAVLQIDRTSTLSLGDSRPSVRISSTDTYEPGTLIVLDMAHAPHGPSVWPAFWTYNDPWADMGEIDVYEGINDRTFGQMSLHTTDGCSRNTSVPQTGQPVSSSGAPSCSINQGLACSVRDTDPASYGVGFNAAGGGVFAVLFAETGISIWRWARADIPTDITNGAPRWATWGTPVAAWDGSTCDTRTYFRRQRLTFDITTCGDWAGTTPSWNNVASSGPVSSKYATCAAAVQDPAAFAEAYFEIKRLDVYSV